MRYLSILLFSFVLSAVPLREATAQAQDSWWSRVAQRVERQARGETRTDGDPRVIFGDRDDERDEDVRRERGRRGDVVRGRSTRTDGEVARDRRGRTGDVRGRTGDVRGRTGDVRGRTGDARGRSGEARGRTPSSRRTGDVETSRYPDDDIYGRDDDYERRGKGKKGKGPKFCRNGQGHPVHGRAWCADKGFGLGDDDWDYDDDRRYDDRRANQRRSLEDIIFGSPRRNR